MTPTTGLLTPAYRLTIGQASVDTTVQPLASALIDLRVELDLELPADRAVIALGNVGGLGAARGDRVTVELGYSSGTLVQVMSGTVVALEPDLEVTRVMCFSDAEAILRTFVEQTYERKTAGAIVRDLAGRAKVDVVAAEDGIDFPAYVVDGRRSAYAHMSDLAALCGFDLYLRPDGKLVFGPFNGGSMVHEFDYGKDIVGLESVRTAPAAAQVQAWGESPMAKQGDAAWPWLTADFGDSKGTAGSGAPLLLLERPVLRTADAAHTAARALFAAVSERALRGRLRTSGSPEVKLGDAIKLQGLPDVALNTTFPVRSVSHRITKRGGFITTIGFQAAAPAQSPTGGGA